MLILSRKGFDRATGGGPSPVFPDGSLISLPIPRKGSPHTYSELGRGEIARYVETLTKNKIRGSSGVHLDPDLEEDLLPRDPRWRPAFGQSGTAQRHLEKQDVGIGDLFLFFGWFHTVETDGKEIRFQKRSPDMHLLFGWLQIGEILPLTGGRRSDCLKSHPWLKDHPHLQNDYPGDPNTLYIASDRLKIDGLNDCPGGGPFRTFAPDLVLTDPHQTGSPALKRSLWSLPKAFTTAAEAGALSYHGSRKRWAIEGDRCRLSTVGRGQEFVLNLEQFPEVMTEWILPLMVRHAGAPVQRTPPLPPRSGAGMRQAQSRAGLPWEDLQPPP